MRKPKTYISKRQKPVNLILDDNKLFNHEYNKILPLNYAKLYKNIYIDGVSLRKFKYFRFKYIHWRMNDEKSANKIKNFFSDALNAFKSKKNKSLKIIESASWIIDVRSDQFFHWLNDCLQRSELLFEDSSKYPILIPEDFLKLDFVINTLELLNLDFQTYKKNELIFIRNLYIAPHCAPSGNYNEIIINKVRSKILDKVKIIDDNDLKIWVSRQKSNRRKISNFLEAVPIIEKHGFKILEFESMSFEKQLNYSKRASVIAGLHGAGLSHLLFARENCKILEIRDKNDSKNNCYFSLASALKMEYYYLKGSAEDNPYNSDYKINLIELNETLKKI